MYVVLFSLLIASTAIGSSLSAAIDNDNELSAALSSHGLSNLYETFKQEGISADNIWVVTDDMLAEWNVPTNDRLTYKRQRDEWKDKEESKGYSKLAAFLISLFLGELGVDWFYLSGGGAGYIVAGIFKMITLGGLGIWWLVDWIRILADAFPDGNGDPLRNDM